VLKNLSLENKNILNITSHKKWISVHPVILCILASLKLENPKLKVNFEIMEATSKHYFERMGLFKYLNLNFGKEVKKYEKSGRFIPLTTIKTDDDLTKFIQELIPLLHLDKKKIQPIIYTISELVRNVLEHSKSKDGAIVCTQYYQKSNIVRLGIVDRGIGIKTSISKSHLVKDDEDAILKSLTPGITGKTSKEGGTEYNAGAGLFFIKSFSSVNKEFFLIYSGTSYYKLLKNRHKKKILNSNPKKDKHSIKSSLPFWKGTVVGVDISIENSEKFYEIFDSIREIYSSSIRKRKKNRYKTPRFT
jgi:anti-sigma regulatory factor (Ser/Thr protein kinase)